MGRWTSNWKPGGDVTINEENSDLGKRVTIGNFSFGEEVLEKNLGLLTAPVDRPAHLPAPYEHVEQEDLITWARANEKQYPGLDLLIHMPNGEYRDDATARKLRRMGVKSGYPDLLLDAAHGGYFGLRIEMKRVGTGVVRDTQEPWLERLSAEGFYCYVAYGAAAAKERLVWYLTQPKTRVVDSYLLNWEG